MASQISSLSNVLHTVCFVRCKICGNEAGNKTHRAREMMFGFGDVFVYLECASCGCVALMDAPEDLARFYPPNYCAFGSRRGWLRGLGKKLRLRSYFGRGFGLGSWLAERYPRPDLAAMVRLRVPKDNWILDVGCGVGKLLLELKALGYKSLMGVDPFIEADIDYPNGVRIRRCSLTEMAKTETLKWDMVMFHHSFEHVPDQRETLEAAARLLATDGICLIRIPVIGYAWEKYGTDWVSLDAPRHFFLHSQRSLRLLAQNAGFRVESVEYDSFNFQFWGSELYRRGIALTTKGVPRRFFNSGQLREFRKKSEELNAAQQGDHAMFMLSLRREPMSPLDTFECPERRTSLAPSKSVT